MESDSKWQHSLPWDPIEPFNYVQKNEFKNVINKICLQIIYI